MTSTGNFYGNKPEIFAVALESVVNGGEQRDTRHILTERFDSEVARYFAQAFHDPYAGPLGDERFVKDVKKAATLVAVYLRDGESSKPVTRSQREEALAAYLFLSRDDIIVKTAIDEAYKDTEFALEDSSPSEDETSFEEHGYSLEQLIREGVDAGIITPEEGEKRLSQLKDGKHGTE